MTHESRPDTAGRRRGDSIELPVLGAERPAGGGRARRRAAPPKPPVVSFVSLGCAKNLVDSEKMLGQLVESGCTISGDESLADTIVVNTCGFLESSRREALDILVELAERKRRGKLKRIVVAGCLVQRDGGELQREVPEIDALVGVNNRDDVVRAVWRMDRDAALDRYLGDYHAVALDSPRRWNDQGRLRLTPRHYAYVRISEGCDQKCTFCTIPSIRGPMHSKTPDEIVAECRELTDDGARELILIGQDTTSYGRDVQASGGLAGLLRRLDSECDAARWIRLMYVYPSVMTDEMIDAIAECERVVKYIDIPLQHISDRVLRAMYRRVTRAQTLELLEKLRRRIPGVTIRTTFIVGFPGETEEEFEELLSFAREAGFDAAGAFKFSLERETPAGRMKDQLDESLKAERYERFMLAQQEVAIAAARRWIGREFETLIDEARQPVKEEQRGASGRARRATVGSLPTEFIARHAGQAPEVDGVCRLRGGSFEAGEFVTVRCVAADGYDLIVESKST
ncbi:MAG: 30S ribosomal protein S12 methylthiotransferase RimO [Phycisphaerae bacterium]